MTVFKGVLILIKRNLNMIIMYSLIFSFICVAVQLATGGKGINTFEETSLNIAVIDRDKSKLSEGLKTYLDKKHNLIPVKDDKKVIQEELFYRNIYYVVTIPEDYQKDYLENGKQLEATKIPGTTSAFFVDQQIQTFLNGVKVLSASGMDIVSAVEVSMEAADTDTKVTLKDKNGYGGKIAPHTFMFQFMPYIMLAVLGYVAGFIMMNIRKKGLRLRIQCSAISRKKQNAQLVLGFLVMGVGLWALCNFLAILLYGKAYLADANLGYYLMNSFCMMLVALAIAFVIGIVIENEVAINGIVNVASLGLCFTCGVMVPLDVLSDSLKKVSQFLPVYWYEIVNTIVGNNKTFTDTQQWNINKGIGIQLLFAVAILGVGMAISKYKEQE